MIAEKYEVCPKCASSAHWHYDGQVCSQCGFGERGSWSFVSPREPGWYWCRCKDLWPDARPIEIMIGRYAGGGEHAMWCNMVDNEWQRLSDAIPSMEWYTTPLRSPE